MEVMSVRIKEVQRSRRERDRDGSCDLCFRYCLLAISSGVCSLSCQRSSRILAFVSGTKGSWKQPIHPC